jgi:geranylgeranyl diphosphate synthase type I
MNLKNYMADRLPVIEENLQSALSQIVPADYPELREMLAYHMGWVGEGAGPRAQGKRIRPLLVLLSAEACGAEWRRVLPAAASVSFLHNFSLIHDDIEDNSDTRRGRPTVWAKWGMPQALNSGDLMFSMAYACMMRLQENGYSADTTLQALRLLQHTIQELVQGQYLDMAFETRQDVSGQAYWQMINGKTAALLSCCCALGGLLSPAEDACRTSLAQYGRALGLAFQVVDDWLGIWGDPAVTGKAVGIDLTSRKKTIPILYGLENSTEFNRAWAEEFTEADVPRLAQLLKDAGAQHHTETLAEDLTRQALDSLALAFPQPNQHSEVLRELALTLTRRDR